MLILTTSIQHCTGRSSHCTKARKRNKSIKIINKEVKLSLFADNIIIYIEKPKESTKQLLELISEFNKVAESKVNIQNNKMPHEGRVPSGSTISSKT